MHGAEALDGEREIPEEAQSNFPQVLARACTRMLRAWGGESCLLFLFDDVADSFAVASVQGRGFDDVVGLAPRGEDTPILLQAMQDVRPVYEVLHNPRNGDLLSCVLVPLWDLVPVGIAAYVGSDRLTESDSADVYSAAREVAHSIRSARPDVDHECLFRGILEIDPGGIAVVEGPDHVFSYATPAFRQIFSDISVPFLGRRARDVLSEADAHGSVRMLDRVRSERNSAHLAQVEVVDAYGPRYYEAHMVPQHSHGKVLDAIYVIFWPRTDIVLTRKALEDSISQLAHSQSLLSAVLNGTNNGIVFFDRDRIVQFANRRAADLLGLNIEQLMGQPASGLVDSLQDRVDGPEGYYQRTLSLFDTMTDPSEDLLELRHPGRRLLERQGSPVYSDAGDLLGRVEVYSDVTETRDLERSKDNFLSLVSHELKTPVTSIKGYSQLLKRRAARESLSEGVVNACNVIERQVERMEGLIDTLLDLSRLDSGRLDLTVERLDLSALVVRIAEMMQLTVDAHVIELDVPGEPVWIDGDVHRLEQMLTNLMSNAVRFSPPGSNITISLRDGAEVQLQVIDEGEGIPEAMQPHVFERFYRVSDAQRSNGMGIGLYITREIVDRHSGSISLQSVEGRGTAFNVILPKTQRAGEAGTVNAYTDTP